MSGGDPEPQAGVTTLDRPPDADRGVKRSALTGTGVAILLTTTHFSIDAVSAILGALLPTLQARFSVTETTLALLVATMWFANSMTQPLFGLLSDRVSPGLVAGLGAMATAALVSLVGVAPSLLVVFALMLVGGLGSGAFHPAATSLTRGAGLRNPGLAVSLLGAGGTAGLAVGPVVVLLIVSTFGLGATPWMMVPGVALGVAMMVLLRRPATASLTSFAPRYLPKLVAGPVGLLGLTTVLASIGTVTFASAIPLWLVNDRGIASEGALIGWTLAVYNVSAAAGGITAALLSSRISRRWLIPTTMVASLIPTFAVFLLRPGDLTFYLAVALAGALSHAALPIMIITAQDLAPYALATASGLMGFSLGVAGVLYAGVGRLQEVLGLVPAMSLAYLVTVPAAMLAAYVLRRHPSISGVSDGTTVSATCRCAPCLCPTCAHSLLTEQSEPVEEYTVGG